MNKETVVKCLKSITLKGSVVKLITAWCFICIVEMFSKSQNDPKINDIKMVQNISIPISIIGIVAGMIFLASVDYFLKYFYPKAAGLVEKLLLLSTTLTYSCLCVLEHSDVYFTVGMVALLSLAVVYCFTDMDVSKVVMPKWAFIAIISAFVAIFVGLVGSYMVMKCLSYSAPNFDMGLFAQMFHYMKTTFTMKTTCERDHLMSHMCVHVAPDFYLLLPFYMLAPSAATLDFLQVCVIASAIIPLVLLCKLKGLSQMETILLAIAFLSYPVMAAGCGYDIHENMFFPVFLLFFLYYMEKDNNIGMVISMVLVWFIKEDAAVFMIFIGLFMMLTGKLKKGTVVLITSILYFVFATKLLDAIGDGAITDRFNNVIYDQDGNLLGVIKTVIASPGYFVTQCMKEDRIKYILQTLTPLLFLPFFTKKWQRFVLVGPYILFNIMADYVYFHDIFFQYSFGPCTLLFYLAICNLCDIDKGIRQKALPAMAVSCVVFFFAFIISRKDIFKYYTSSEVKENSRIITEALDTIPDNGSVIATTFLVTGLADHDEVYELVYTDKKAEYLALDLRGNSNEYNYYDYASNADYEQLYYKAGVIAVFRYLKY